MTVSTFCCDFIVIFCAVVGPVHHLASTFLTADSVNYTISHNARTPFIRKTQDRIIRAKQLNTNRRMAFGVPKSGRRLITFNKLLSNIM